MGKKLFTSSGPFLNFLQLKLEYLPFSQRRGVLKCFDFQGKEALKKKHKTRY